MTNKEYPVGYGKPPVHSRFKPGQSGNGKGRAKGSRNLATDVAEELSEKLLVTEGGRQRRITKQRAMLKALVAKSLKGDARAAATLLRLIPGAEEQQKERSESQTLTQTDNEILEAFRAQLKDELNATKAGGKNG